MGRTIRDKQPSEPPEGFPLQRVYAGIAFESVETLTPNNPVARQGYWGIYNWKLAFVGTTEDGCPYKNIRKGNEKASIYCNFQFDAGENVPVFCIDASFRGYTKATREASP